MANKTIVDYLKSHIDKFRLEDLKNKILSQGYSEEEYREALKEVHSFHETLKKNHVDNSVVKPKNQEVNKSIQEDKKDKTVVKPKNLEVNKSIQEDKKAKGKLLLVSSICGFILLGFYLISLIPNFSDFMPGIVNMGLEGMSYSYSVIALYIIIFVVLLVSLFIFLSGFVKLGNVSKSKLLKVTSIITIIILGILLLLFIAGVVFSMNAMANMSPLTGMAVSNNNIGGGFEPSTSGGFGSPSNDDFRIEGNPILDSMTGAQKTILFNIIGFTLFYLALKLLFSTSLILIRDKIKISLYAGVLGILQSIIGVLGVSFILFIIFNPAYFIELMMYFMMSGFEGDISNILFYIKILNMGLTILTLAVLTLESLVLLKGHKKFEA